MEIHESWRRELEGDFNKAYFNKAYFNELIAFVKMEYETKEVYPPSDSVFNAFEYCPFDNVNVVIVGQDPYHGPLQADGLCFSVSDGLRHPPSLKNIFKEINNDLGIAPPESGNLKRWARQGVLLLNSMLTVRAGQPGSHQKKGWETFTNKILQLISDKRQNVVFLLWGAYAQKKCAFIDEEKHCVLKAPHPSPFSANRGFFGCKHFSKTNQSLEKAGLTPIEW